MNQKYYKAGTAILLSVVIFFMFAVFGISGAEMAKGTPASPGAIVLAKGGVTEYVIVESRKQIPAERTAVTDLAKYLKKVTGAEFKIVKEKPGEKLDKGIGNV